MVSGRLTRDPEMRSTQSGQEVTFFDAAVNRRYKDTGTGEWKDDTVFIPVSVWGPQAQRCKEKLKKGSPVLVEGRLASSEYTDKTGQKRRVLRLNARKVQFLFYGDSASVPVADSGAASSSSEGASADFKEDVGGMDEVPF